MIILWGMKLNKMNIERPISNVEGEKLAKHTYNLEESLLKKSKWSFKVCHRMCGKNEIILRSEATSLFDVQR